MAGQQPGKRAIQELVEDMPPIGSKGGELPAFPPCFFLVTRFYEVVVSMKCRPKTTEAKYLPDIRHILGSGSLLQAVKV